MGWYYLFKHKNRQCAIRKGVVGYCGYVAVTTEEYEKITECRFTEEITRNGVFDETDFYFIGFDSAHIYDNWQTQTLSAVKGRTIQFCNEILNELKV